MLHLKAFLLQTMSVFVQFGDIRNTSNQRHSRKAAQAHAEQYKLVSRLGHKPDLRHGSTFVHLDSGSQQWNTL